jgi:hypothetical protein
MKTNFIRSGAGMILVAVGVFSGLIAALWFTILDESHQAAAWMGGIYALVCFAFLIFQMVAFVSAHADYDQSVEVTKFEPLYEEAREWGSS